MNADLWIAALRSGEYKQCTGGLCNDGKYCCLGVATEIYMKHNPGKVAKTRPQGLSLYNIYTDSNGHAQKYGLLKEVEDWYRIDLAVRIVGDDGRYAGLVCLNDDLQKSFTEIADVLEKHKKEFFPGAKE